MTNNKRQNTHRIRTRPDAIIIRTEGIPYSEMLKKIKTNKEVQEVGENLSIVSMTKAGHLRVILNKDTKEEDKITKELTNAIGENITAVNL